MKTALSCIGVLAVAAICVPGRAADGNAAGGKRLYTAYGCYQCHGRDAQGSSTTGPRLGPNPIALAAFIRYVRHPGGQMPPYTSKVAADAELADIYAFLQAVPQPARVQDIPLLSNPKVIQR
jgi:ubiquinol-cytochrome c reductase cytochrome c subunit